MVTPCTPQHSRTPSLSATAAGSDQSSRAVYRIVEPEAVMNMDYTPTTAASALDEIEVGIYHPDIRAIY